MVVVISFKRLQVIFFHSYGSCRGGSRVSSGPMLRLERELDPRGPRFENAGLWRKVGGEVQLRGDAIAWDAHARAKCEVGIEV